MNHENTNNYEAADPEQASRQEYIGAFEAVEQAVFFAGVQDYRDPAEAFGTRTVNGRRIERYSEQPHVDLGPVGGADLSSNIPPEEAAALGVLGIGSSSEVALSFASDCDERDYSQEGVFNYAPGSVVLAVTLPFAQGEKVGFQSKTFEIALNQSGETSKAQGNYEASFETYEQKLDVHDTREEDLDEPIGRFDPADVAAEGIKAEITKKEGDKLVDAEAAIEVGGENNRPYLTSKEVDAIRTVATYFSVPSPEGN